MREQGGRPDSSGAVLGKAAPGSGPGLPDWQGLPSLEWKCSHPAPGKLPVPHH